MRRQTSAVFAGAVVALVILSLHPVDGTLVRAGWVLSLVTALIASFALWLRDEYRGTTRLLFEAPSLNAVPVDRLEPGDFAVTSNGVHVLAYLGDGRWIQADPGADAVVTVDTPSADPWFGVPVHVMRWEALAD